MKGNVWSRIFFAVLLLHLLALVLHWHLTGMITKTLLMLTLARFFIASVPFISAFRTFILLALLFSWGGDVLLMFQRQNSGYFLAGLSSFLIAHLFYIFFFHRVRKQQAIKSRLWTLLIIATYYSFLIALLNPWLDEMRLPVRVYGLVISFMLLLALHLFYLRNKVAGRYMASGAILFVLSDSILAINKFMVAVPAADLLIMLSYGLAQFFLVCGAAHFLRQDAAERVAAQKAG